MTSGSNSPACDGGDALFAGPNCRVVLMMMLSFSIASALGGHLIYALSGRSYDSGGGSRSVDVLSAWVAEWAYTRADAYFLRGTGQGFVSSVLGIDAHGAHGTSCGNGGHLENGWLEAFGSHFRAGEHTHMGDDNNSGKVGDQVREVLPWLRLAVALNPDHLDAWLLGAHLLRKSMNKHAEAELFLNEALKHHPNHHEIHFSLGQIMEEHHDDAARARSHWLDALRDCEHREGIEGDPFVMRRIVGSLARLEEREGRLGDAMTYLAQLKVCSPNPHLIERWMEEVQAKISGDSGVKTLVPVEPVGGP